MLTPDGELLLLSPEQAARRLGDWAPPLLVHAAATFRRMHLGLGPAFDLLELFAFVCPARTAAPTPRGIASALDFENPPSNIEAEVATLPDLAVTLLRRLAQGRTTALNRDAPALAARMGGAG